jgi:hypothetical protein
MLSLSFNTEDRGKQIPMKHWQISTKLYDVMAQMIIIFKIIFSHTKEKTTGTNKPKTKHKRTEVWDIL